MRQKFFVFLFVCVSVFAAACNSSNNNPPANQNGVSPNADNKPPQPINTSPNQPKDKNTPPQVLQVSVSKVGLTAGGSTDAVVLLKIADGYHVNANPTSEKFLKPTEVEITAANGITADKPVYPQALNKKFAFSDKELAVYENQATIKVKLRASKNAAKGDKVLNGVVRYQACDNEVCYPPAKMDLMIPVSVN